MPTHQPRRNSGYTTRQSATEREKRDIYKNNQVSFTYPTRRKMSDSTPTPSNPNRRNGNGHGAGSAHITPVPEEEQKNQLSSKDGEDKKNETNAVETSKATSPGQINLETQLNAEEKSLSDKETIQQKSAPNENDLPKSQTNEEPPPPNESNKPSASNCNQASSDQEHEDKKASAHIQTEVNADSPEKTDSESKTQENDDSKHLEDQKSTRVKDVVSKILGEGESTHKNAKKGAEKEVADASSSGNKTAITVSKSNQLDITNSPENQETETGIKLKDQPTLAQFGFNSEHSGKSSKESKSDIPSYHVEYTDAESFLKNEAEKKVRFAQQQNSTGKDPNDFVTIKFNLIKMEDDTTSKIPNDEVNNNKNETKHADADTHEERSIVEKQTELEVSKSNQEESVEMMLDDSNHSSPLSGSKQRKKKRKKSKPQTRSAAGSRSRSRSRSRSKSPKVRFSQSTNGKKLAPPTEEDDDNTIGSHETTFNLTREEADRTVPPHFIRYRFGLSLDKVNLATMDLSDQAVQESLSPSNRCRAIMTELISFLQSHDKEAVFISWKNDNGFESLKADPSKLPKEAVKVAKFFHGFKAKMKEGTRCYLNFCLHTPGKTEPETEAAMKEWSRSSSHSIYKCDIQVENAKVIGWLVYSYSFTHIPTLKNFLMDKSRFEWGFKLASPTQSDKHLDWKERVKALSVIVPMENEETAKMIISETFNPFIKKKEHKSFSDTYLFVGNEYENKTESLSVIFSAMIGRHKFRLMHISTAFITCIVKDIDTRILTIDCQRITLREMILNLPSYEQKLGKSKLFLSIDYTPCNRDVWFKKKQGIGGAGYILSFYSWDEGEALETVAGLGEYIGHYYGKDHVYAYFSADHWEATKQWVWNEELGKMDTPTQRHLADNVLHDPTAEIMEAYHVKQQLDLRAKELQDRLSTLETDEESKNSMQGKDRTVQKLRSTGTAPNVNPKDDSEIAAEAMSIAKSIRTTTMAVFQNEEEDQESVFMESPQEDILNSAQLRAKHILQSELDPDLSSIPGPDDATKKVSNMVYIDDKSVASEMTDITDNTENKTYHHVVLDESAPNNNEAKETETKSVASMGTSQSVLSFKSLHTVIAFVCCTLLFVCFYPLFVNTFGLIDYNISGASAFV